MTGLLAVMCVTDRTVRLVRAGQLGQPGRPVQLVRWVGAKRLGVMGLTRLAGTPVRQGRAETTARTSRVQAGTPQAGSRADADRGGTARWTGQTASAATTAGRAAAAWMSWTRTGGPEATVQPGWAG